MAFALVADGRTIFARGYGTTSVHGGQPITPVTLFRVGSVTKPLTALGVLVLVSRGLIDLDAPAVNYLPELAGLVYPAADSAPLTVRHLLTHTSGLPGMVSLPPSPTDQDLRLALSGLRLEREPGALPPRYSNFAYGVVGSLIGRVARMPYERFMDQEVLHPLGMHASVWTQAGASKEALASAYRADGAGRPTLVARHWRLGALAASGGLYSNLNDLARWASNELDAHSRTRSQRTLVPRSLIRAAHRPSALFDVRQTGGQVFASASALGWWVHRDCEFDHIVIKDGAMMGYSASVLMLPARGAALIGLTNSRYSLNTVLKQAARLLLGSGGLSPRTTRPSRKLGQRARAVTELFDTWNAARFKAVFTQGFRDQVTPSDFRAWMAWQQTTLGSCSFERFTEVRSRNDASWIARCEKGIRKFSMPLADAKLGHFDAVSSLAVLQPDVRLIDTARQWLSGEKCAIADSRCEAVVAEMRAREIALPCNVGALIDGNGLDVSGFELSCDGRELRLWLQVEAGSLKAVRVNDIHASTRCVK